MFRHYRNISNVRKFFSQITNLCVILGVVFACVSPASANAETAASNNLSVFFIIDDSGSMQENDPENLRFTAVKLFISLLDPEDGAGVITFASGSQINVHYTPAQDKLALINAVPAARSDGYTDMRAAFQNAAELVAEDETGNEKVIIFLTDGHPELSGGLPAGYTNETLDIIRQINLPVLSIGLTSSGLSPFLGQIKTAAAPGSEIIPARSATDILDVYLGILGQLKDRTVLGTGTVNMPGQASLAFNPGLTPYIDSISFIAVKPGNSQANLISPEGSQVDPDNVMISEKFVDVDPRFVVLTMETPVGGDWQMSFSGSGLGQARAILRSRLRINVISPGHFAPVNEPLPIIANLIVEDPPNPPSKSIGDETSFSAKIEGPNGQSEILDRLYDDGTHGDAVAGDGDFTNIFMNASVPGPYLITITGYKGIVPVSNQVQVELIEFPQVMIDEPTDCPITLKKDDPLPIQAHLQGGDPPELDQGRVEARITRPDGMAEEPIMLNLVDSGYYAEYLPTQDGPYTIEVSSVDATYRGIAYNTSDALSCEATVIPEIVISPVDGDATTGIDLGSLLNMQNEQTITLKIESHSAYEETLEVSVAGLTGGTVTPLEISLAPNEARTVVLGLQSDAILAPGIYTETRVIFNARPGVILVNPEIPVGFEIASVLVKLEPSEISFNSILQLGADFVVRLQATSNSPFPQELKIDSVEPAEFQASIDPTHVLANTITEIKLALSHEGKLQPGDYTIKVHFAIPAPNINLSPETITINMHVPTWLERFGLITGLIVGTLLLVAIIIYMLIKAPFGTLVGTKAPNGEKLQNYYLRKYNKLSKGYNKKVTIGGKGCDIALKSLIKERAVFSAGTATVTKQVGRGVKMRTIKAKRTATFIAGQRGTTVAVNGSYVPSTGTALNRNDVIKIGDYEFKYS